MSIPDEIAKKAIETYEDAIWRGGGKVIAMRVALTAVLPALTAAAVAQEREACAKIAETLKTLRVWLPTLEGGKGEDEHTTIHGEEIAAIIRARSNTP